MIENEKVDILSAITEKAENDRAAAINSAEEYARDKAEKAKQLAEETAASWAAETAIAVQDISKKNEVAVRMEKNRVALAARRKCVDRVYEILLQKLRAMGAEDFLRLVSVCVQKYGEKGQTLILAKSAPVGADEVKSLKAVKDLGLKVEVSAEIKDGFVLSGESYDRDFTLAAIVDGVKESTEKETSEKTAN